jgi:subtilase family serine protease
VIRLSVRPSFVIRTLLPALAGLGLLAPAAGAATSSWVDTGTHALNLRGQLLGHTPPATRLEVSAVLPLRDRAAINQLIESRQILTPAAVRERFSPTGATVRAVTGYLASQGFSNLTVSGNSLLVTGDATVAQAERAFHTTISNFNLNGRTVYANTAVAQVPAALAHSVVAVLGLSDVPMNVPDVRAQATPGAKQGVSLPQLGGSSAASSPDLSGFTPKALENAYQASALPPASATEIAVLTSGDMTPTISDLRKAEKAWSYPAVKVDVRYDGPSAGIVNNNPLSGNAEWSLDTQISTEMAHNVSRLEIYDVATFTDPEVARGINLFVSDDRASSLSVSLGECDYIAFLDGAMISTDEALAEGALQGQSSFASTGDNGYACPEVASTGVPEGPPGDSWPSDGEYTAGVGGTTLLADANGNVSNEIAWIGGGGGSSPWETAPPWTLQAYPVNQEWQYTNQGGRAVPDVAALADSTTPALIYAGGSQEGVGGTSVASPLTMGLWARANNTSGDKFGLAQYDFYALYNNANPATVVSGPLGPTYVPATSPAAVNGFRDITLGTNGGCVAKAGYDACTGIGSLQTASLAKALHALL